jgi:hypothetical protein
MMSEIAIGSPLLRGRAPLVLDLPEDAWFDVELAHKDIRLTLAPTPARTERGNRARSGFLRTLTVVLP